MSKSVASISEVDELRRLERLRDEALELKKYLEAERLAVYNSPPWPVGTRYDRVLKLATGRYVRRRKAYRKLMKGAGS